jgi:serine/threonine protein phosphatase 1
MSTWIKRLFGGGTAAGAQRDGGPCAPDGVRLYAVGDVHGRLDLLDDLLARIAADSAATPERRHVLVMLGDLIDRGPASAGGRAADDGACGNRRDGAIVRKS